MECKGSDLGALAGLSLDELERRARTASGRALGLREWVALAEAWRIARALEENRGNRSAAARALGIGRRTLYTKLEKLGWRPECARSPGSERDLGAWVPRAAGSSRE